MKHILINCVWVLLLLTACQETESLPKSSSPEIGELMARTEQIKISTRSSSEKKEFEIGDEIFVFGFAKTTDPGKELELFMPDDVSSTVGLTFIYDNYLSRIRFGREATIPDPEMGFWRVGQWHKFNAYYRSAKSDTEVLTFTMDEDGLTPEDFLWGESNEVYFNGDAVLTPTITFKHQLSRIRVELVHDTEPHDAENITITGLDVKLNRKQDNFDLVTGKWEELTPKIPIVLEQRDLGKNLKGIERLVAEPITSDDWWTLPNCEIIELILYFTRNGTPYDTTVTFKSNNDPNASPVTRAGYITQLRLHIDDIKSIVFTAALKDWDVYDVYEEEGKEILISD